jgi:ribonuclease HIII
MNQSQTVTITIDEKTLKRMMEFYEDDLTTPSGPYQLALIKRDNLSIVIYHNDKSNTKHKVVFQGPSPLMEAQLWDKNALINESITKKNFIKEVYQWPHYGSDEVGTGSFFGPVVVVGTFLNDETLSLVKAHGVNDSKKMSDEKILSIAPLLMKKVKYHQFTISNEKYNELIEQGYNLNAIKARLHYQALLNIKKLVKRTHPLFIDQFCTKNKFYAYVGNMEKLDGNILFQTHAEDVYPAVATSSVIARYLFINHLKKLSKEYQIDFPYGSGKDVDQFGKNFIKSHGREAFDKISKHHFKNYQRIIDSLND